MLVCHDAGAKGSVQPDFSLHGCCPGVLDLAREARRHALAFRIRPPCSHRPGRRASFCWRACFFVGVLVFLLAAHKGLVCLDLPPERRIERFSLGGMPESVQHEPCGFLRDRDISCELRAGNTLLMRRDQVDRHEPLVQPDLGILEDRANLDRKPLPAVAAFMRPVIGKMVDFDRTAVRAERAVAPADRAEMINAGLLVREGRDHLVQAGELLDRNRPSIAGTTYPRFRSGSSTYINSPCAPDVSA